MNGLIVSILTLYNAGIQTLQFNFIFLSPKNDILNAKQIQPGVPRGTYRCYLYFASPYHEHHYKKTIVT